MSDGENHEAGQSARLLQCTMCDTQWTDDGTKATCNAVGRHYMKAHPEVGIGKGPSTKSPLPDGAVLARQVERPTENQ